MLVLFTPLLTNDFLESLTSVNLEHKAFILCLVSVISFNFHTSLNVF